MESNSIKRVKHNSVALAFIAGLAVPVVSSNIVRLFGATESIGHPIIALLVLVAAGMFAGYRTPDRVKAAGWSVYGALPVGVVVDVMIDWFLRSFDRNLFPFEIVGWLILAPLPIYMGIVLGRDLGQQNEPGASSDAKP